MGERLFSSKVYDPSKIFLSPTGINLFCRDKHNHGENKIALEVFEPVMVGDI
ncbi:hypothetical protein ADIS_1984 [Lunatimonas lonarensis]|uniref:Uncharacterized protein n=1 Tax=Lunatimonas lonarensis TaxID=1232681 RepID=R7ZTT5_9BACT|nr:hypothetical protein ADIS_1984 [Lunatimonas lonarensis]